jgi:hypothetical protein
MWNQPPPPEVTVKVTTINGRHHARLFRPDGSLVDEMACEDKRDLPFICRTVLRWYNKMGGDSQQADRARHRNKEGHGKDGLVGKVWYKREIDEERLAANIKKMRVEDALNHLTSPDEIKRQAALEVLKGNQ